MFVNKKIKLKRGYLVFIKKKFKKWKKIRFLKFKKVS
jgi:hypothetical protein